MSEGALLFATGIALRELAMFAAVGFLIGGIDDLAIDLIWIGRTLWRRWRVPAARRADTGNLPPAAEAGRIAVFVPAWDESAVIARMVALTLARFDRADFRLYVGCYPNDRATLRIVRAFQFRDARVRPVVCARPGPTSKADCLNHLWRAMLADEAEEHVRTKAIVLHDAEDVVHPFELRLFDRLIEQFALVQLPVVPLVDTRSLWSRLVSGHYCDEFAEAHGKQMVVREALGAAIPSAGVGCAIARDAIQRIADDLGGAPFDPGSLTEDYEIGLKIAAAGGRGAFVRLPGRGVRGMVAVREHFPANIRDAVRQKARWMNGIALAGWDRVGWQGGLADRWMLLRDRRALVAALVLAAAYAALLIWGLLLAHAVLTRAPLPDSGVRGWLMAINLVLLSWRMLVRGWFVAPIYGWRAAALVPLRMVIANIIEMMAAARAIAGYARSLRGGIVAWDKTAHRFPDGAAVE